MASTSGVTTFNLDLAEAIEEAYERAGGELRSGYDFRTARRSLNLLLADWSNRGLNMWTFDQQTIPLQAGVNSYTLPADTVDVLDAYVRTFNGIISTDQVITRVALPVYNVIPNKLAQGRPVQFTVSRAQAAPTITLWMVPLDSTTYTLVYWRLRRIQDAGTGANVLDIPFRFIPTLVAGLAYYLAIKKPEVDMNRLTVLKQQYDEAWEQASDEDREKASIRLVPRRGV